jgi:hypothetical protein
VTMPPIVCARCTYRRSGWNDEKPNKERRVAKTPNETHEQRIARNQEETDNHNNSTTEYILTYTTLSVILVSSRSLCAWNDDGATMPMIRDSPSHREARSRHTSRGESTTTMQPHATPFTQHLATGVQYTTVSLLFSPLRSAARSQFSLATTSFRLHRAVSTPPMQRCRRRSYHRDQHEL